MDTKPPKLGSNQSMSCVKSDSQQLNFSLISQNYFSYTTKCSGYQLNMHLKFLRINTASRTFPKLSSLVQCCEHFHHSRVYSNQYMWPHLSRILQLVKEVTLHLISDIECKLSTEGKTRTESKIKQNGNIF